MSAWAQGLLAFLPGYLLGAISFARLIVRLVDPTRDAAQAAVRSGATGELLPLKRVGATSVSIVLGPRYGGLVTLLDMLKVLLPTVAVRLLWPGTSWFLLTALAGTIGHIWPVYYRFQGGTGMSPVCATLLVVDPLGALGVSLLSMFIGAVPLHNPMLGAFLGPWLMVPWLALVRGDLPGAGLVMVSSVLLIVAMVPELRRMWAMRKEGQALAHAASMEDVPMGRMINQWVSRLGLRRGPATRRR